RGGVARAARRRGTAAHADALIADVVRRAAVAVRARGAVVEVATAEIRVAEIVGTRICVVAAGGCAQLGERGRGAENDPNPEAGTRQSAPHVQLLALRRPASSYSHRSPLATRDRGPSFPTRTSCVASGAKRKICAETRGSVNTRLISESQLDA